MLAASRRIAMRKLVDEQISREQHQQPGILALAGSLTFAFCSNGAGCRTSGTRAPRASSTSWA
jgi:hypothetical protein